MKTVNVSKASLMEALKANREIHIKEFKEVQEVYQEQVVEGLTDLLKRAQADINDVHHSLDLSKPRSYEDEYNTAIEMLEMSVDDNLVITADEFRQYVKNIWNWTRNFDMMKTSYSKGI